MKPSMARRLRLAREVIRGHAVGPGIMAVAVTVTVAIPVIPGLQLAQNRSCLYTLGPKVGIVYIVGALGLLSLWLVPFWDYYYDYCYYC